MAHITAFRALRYDPERVELAKTVTQPYDKISLQMQGHYYDASPHNLVRIILGKRQPADTSGDNVYTRAASFFRDWQRQGIFLQDSTASFYAYSQRFVRPGDKAVMERRGFIGLGHLEDYSAGVVFRHEQTLAKPKADRLELLRATRAHFEQLFMLYSGAGEIESLLPAEEPADLEVTDEYDVRHRVWRISEPRQVRLIADKMRDKKLIIADGHHRYETALNYRNEQRTALTAVAAGTAGRSHFVARGSSGTDTLEVAPYDFAMMTFIDMDSPGLVILPTHRVIHGVASFSSEKLQIGAQAYFEIQAVNSSVDAEDAVAILREAGRNGTALLAVTADRAFLMRVKEGKVSAALAGVSPRQRALDVVQLHKCVLEGVLGLSPESIQNQQNLTYVREAGEALKMVRGGGANVAFLMNPARMEQVRDIAFAGEVLPQKSTDFYPKLLSGLTIYALDTL
ncbi:MAG TPA: DUF1015 domain-containing protein [Terriglobales bacterium]|nr:DUF1015 domain-containing protein [Terriglobales bacterium]